MNATIASTVNRIVIAGAATGNNPSLQSEGSDTNIGLDIKSKGAAPIVLSANALEQFRIQNTSGGDSNLQVVSGTGGGTMSVRGTATNSDVILTGKGTGGVRVQDGGGANKFRVNTTGIGFFNTTPATQGALAAPTGTITRTTFATSSVTVSQLAERVYAIINDLRAYGLFS